MSRASFKAVVMAVAATVAIASHVHGNTVLTDSQRKYNEGYELGYPIGHQSGLVSGKERGREVGMSSGMSEGFRTGWSAAYSPAFDLAYDVRFPVGHRAGWEDGIVEGFLEGFDYAPTVAAQIFDDWNNGSDASAGFGSVSIRMVDRSIDLYSLGGTLDVSLSGAYDWYRHFFNQGFDDGKLGGFSAGSDEGYSLTYPIAYAAGYKIGHRNGVGEGIAIGTHDGQAQGYDEGWNEGHDVGFDEGFYAGIDYHLFGEFAEPVYALQYTPRSSSFTAQTLLALQAPEPTSLVLVGLVVGAGLLLRPGRANCD